MRQGSGRPCRYEAPCKVVLSQASPYQLGQLQSVQDSTVESSPQHLRTIDVEGSPAAGGEVLSMYI